MKTFVFLGCLQALLAIALGAFGAHTWRDALDAKDLAVYQTGVQYHQMHALVLVLVGVLRERLASRRLVTVAGWLFVAGIAFFSGSLYALALTRVDRLGAITPIGGACFLAGWALLAVAAIRHRAV